MEDRGLFIKPTVFSEVTDTMRIAKEEVLRLQAKLCPVGPCDELGPQGVERGLGDSNWSLTPGPGIPEMFVRGAFPLVQGSFPSP